MNRGTFAARTSVLALGLLLAGCGGGDAGSGGVGSTPPPPGYTKIVDMSGNRTFQTAGVTYDTAPSGFTNGVVNTFGNGVTVAYSAGTDSYTVTAPGGATQTFGPADLQPPTGGTPTSVQYAKVNGTTREQLTLIAPGGPVPLSYTVIGTWGSVNTTTNAGPFRVAIGGAPTLAGDMPKTGTASYGMGVGGTAIVPQGTRLGTATPYNLGGSSSGTFSANFASGTISTTLNLGGTPLGSSGGPATNFGTFTGTGSLSSGGPGFSGTLTGTAADGIFAGLFLGPQAVEMGFGYVLTGPAFSAVGGASGIKQ